LYLLVGQRQEQGPRHRDCAERSSAVWCPDLPAISANGIENFEPPPEVRKRVIFGDTISTAAGSVRLTNSPGRLADRISVQVEIPNEPGADWNARAISNSAR